MRRRNSSGLYSNSTMTEVVAGEAKNIQALIWITGEMVTQI
jgi:hypothetical protein